MAEDQPPRRPTWTTRDGRVIPIIDMEDTHLNNTIAFLARQGYESMRVALELRVQGKPESEYSEEERIHLVQSKMVKIPKATVLKYIDMLNERKRRDEERLHSPLHDERTTGSDHPRT